MGEGRGVELGGGYRHLALDTVGSTNAECLARASAGEAGPLWVTANRQQSGRGRRGRLWVSEPGNLYASLLLTNPAPPACLGQLPMVVAVALQQAAARATGQGERLRIKWPNDLLLDGMKVAGILLESQGLPDGRTVVVIGIGVNCRHAPEQSETPATSLAACGLTVAPDILFAHLVEAVDQALRAWRRGTDFARIRERWLAACRGLGDPIRVRLHDRELHGRFAALDRDGQLILELSEGHRETISAGDVFLLGPTTGPNRG
ncbi:MAG: biotin--[acetyl-CoA-carboxylase] ligase [Hyphomicrobiaceae bacterium]|nr:biotin--[acetyl-CoA-carboxylase] ligase [Hyphomicrobiaceae bacterium]